MTAKLIAFEGIDGSGKGTQAAALADWIRRDQGLKACLFQFPQYKKTFGGQKVGEYLNGGFDTKVPERLEPQGLPPHPFLCSLLYSLDRLESKPELEHRMETNDVVVIDRFFASNYAHQMAKYEESEAQTEILTDIVRVERDIMGLPEPDLTFCLDLPSIVAQQNVLKKKVRDYTTKDLDDHEADVQYLSRVRDCYLELAYMFQSSWVKVPVVDTENQMRPIEDILHVTSEEFLSRFR